MKKTLAMIAAGLMIASFTAPAFAETVDAKKLAEACKGKKKGDTVKVDGKDAKCP